jgi:hypothetical protein
MPKAVEAIEERRSGISWRVSAMREQLAGQGRVVLPFLCARPVELRGPCSCRSCGDPLSGGEYLRCALCSRAAQIVLGV